MISRKNFHFLSSIFILHTAFNASAWQTDGSSGSGGGFDSLRAARTGWTQEEDSWNYWWSYSGVSGPLYWGLLNPDWFMCDRGRRQSPIDVTTRALIYDPNLKPLRADNNLISGILYNDGHSIVFNGSLAAAVRFSHLERHKPQASTTAASGSGQAKAAELAPNSTAASGTTTKSRRDTAAVPSNQLDGTFVLVADANTDDNTLTAERGLFSPASPPLLMREMSNNIELGVGGVGESPETAQEDARLAEQSLGENAAADQLIGALSHVHFSGGPSPYSYKFETLQLKFGPAGTAGGSEHHINGRAFAAELQVFAYNWQLYKNYEEASTRPHGLMAISVLIDTDDESRPPLAANETTSRDQKSTSMAPQVNVHLERLLSVAVGSIAHRGHYAPILDLNLSALLPDTEQFVTYEGSLTQPGCHESVVWLILNRPLYISKQNLDKLRSISADEQLAQSPTGTLIAGNSRPVQSANNRPVRTNIRPSSGGTSDKSPKESCPRLWTRYEYM